MRLLIIGHTAHYQRGNRIVGWGPTVKEIDWLAKAFDSVVHLAFLHSGTAPRSALPYQSDNIRFIGLPPSGGVTAFSKFKALALAPRYSSAILKLRQQADIIHIRTPGVLGLYGLLCISLHKSPLRWTKFAGNWGEPSTMPFSFRLQREWLTRGLSRGPVTINGRWQGQPDFVFSFLNPCMTIMDVIQARQEATDKNLTSPLRVVFAGRLEANKQPLAAIQIVNLVSRETPVRLDLIGDGPQRQQCHQLIEKLNLGNQVFVHGWLEQEEVRELLRQAHFVLLPSLSEGLPKIILEGMAFGAVPIASHVSAIPQLLQECQCGEAIPASDILTFAERIVSLSRDAALWKSMSQAGLHAAPRFTYEKYLLDLEQMFNQYYRLSPMNAAMLRSLQEQYQAISG